MLADDDDVAVHEPVHHAIDGVLAALVAQIIFGVRLGLLTLGVTFPADADIVLVHVLILLHGNVECSIFVVVVWHSCLLFVLTC